MGNLSKKYKWLISFLKIGCIGFGGGTSLIPVMEQEMVRNQKKVTKEQYDTAVIVSSITPGAFTVKLSAYLGNYMGGTKGMMFSALAMALPGAFLTVLLLAMLSSVDSVLLKQIELVSIGITAFIFTMLTKYISSTLAWAKSKKRYLMAITIILGVFILSSGKSVAKILSHFGVAFTSRFSISTIDVLILAFFVLCYYGVKRTWMRFSIASLVSVLYLSCVARAQFMYHWIGNDVVYRVFYILLQLGMLGLSVYGVIAGKDKKQKIKRISPKQMLKEEIAWVLLIIASSIPAILLVPGTFAFLKDGILSAIISFGGGDAYLTVADGMFVSSGMIQEADFYGRLVIIANVLPGSILCKILAGIGYYMGFYQGGILPALALAFAGFSCSVTGSCAAVSLIRYFFNTYEKIKVFQMLKSWIKAIISGLLGNVILSLLHQSMTVGKNYDCNVLIVVAELAVIYALNLFMDKRLKCGTWVNVSVSCVLALVVGNIIM